MAGDEDTNEPLSKELLESVGELASELNRKHAADLDAGLEGAHATAVSLASITAEAPAIGGLIAHPEIKAASITAPSASREKEIRRVMRPITDTRLARMGQPVVRPVAASTAAKPASTTAPEEPRFAYLPKIPAALARRPADAMAPPVIAAATSGTRPFLLGADHDAASFAADDQPAASAGPAIAPPTLPSPLPAPAAAAAGGRIDDITAALLRPMLKRWVEDNMQALVTLALHRETGGSGKVGKPRA